MKRDLSLIGRLSPNRLMNLFITLVLFGFCFLYVMTALADSESAVHAMADAKSQQAALSGVPAIPGNGKVFFENLNDGETVRSPVEVVMGVKGLDVEPAGPITPGKGHHHLLIDTVPIPTGLAIPNDEKHLHFGKGQTETTISLPPGKHTLILQFADGAHRSYGPQLSASININVVAN